MDINLNNLPDVIHASFILHNNCEMNGESIASESVEKAISYEREFQPAAPNASSRLLHFCKLNLVVHTKSWKGAFCIDCETKFTEVKQAR